MGNALHNDTVWSNKRFVRLFWAHTISLVGTAIGTAAIALLAEDLNEGSGPRVLGYTLTIRIIVFLFLGPFAGSLSERIGRKLQMIVSDILRALVMVSLFFVNAEWQLYFLAFVLHLSSALFTPIYKSIIPGVVGEKLYPKALAYGTVAYNISDILGMLAGGLLIFYFGFEIGFGVDAASFLLSAGLIAIVPFSSAGRKKEKQRTKVFFGIRRMFAVPELRRSLMLSLQVSIVGGLAIVTTAGYVKNELQMEEAFYPVAMAVMGIGAMVASLYYVRCGLGTQKIWGNIILPIFLIILAATALFKFYFVLLIAWLISGAGQGVFGIISNNLLAQNSDENERPHIYAAQFALSHAGWGLSYPLCGVLASVYSFAAASWACLGLMLLTMVPMIGRRS
jgi:NRE family putative nickel resistance protein-like MFS transporter